MSFEERKAARLKLLHRLYEATDGDSNESLPIVALGHELGFDRQTTIQIADYLKNEGLLEYVAFGPIASLTHFGVTQVEAAQSSPTEPTHYFPAFNVIQVGKMIGSNIQQGTIDSQQIVEREAHTELRSVFPRLEEALRGIDLEASRRSDLEAELETIKSQLKSSKPKSVIVKESLKSLRSIVEGVAGSAVAAALLSRLLELL